MRLYATIILSSFSSFAFGQTISNSTISLQAEFNKAVEISSIAWVQDSIYMPAAKCGLVFIGKIEGQRIEFRIKKIKKRNYEGLAYCNNNFYLSIDTTLKIYKYNKTFDTQIDSYPIVLRNGDEKNKGNNGFEGIAVINDTIFYILLEKEPINGLSVLYKGVLRNRQIMIQDKKYLSAEEKSRYCDLYFKNGVLYLLKSSFYGKKHKLFNENNCNPRNDYEIRALKLDKDLNIEKKGSPLIPDLQISLTRYVHDRCNSFNSNIEGITMDNNGNFYIVSDNYNGDPPSCNAPGESNTLLMLVSQ